MKVIALVSGGKDSTFNMMECVRMGHQIVALANLFPAGSEHADAPDEADELDSYCFQTVGHSVIAAYSQCMGVPLHRRAISAGASKNQDMVYDVTQNDEVEDLFQLLAEVKRLHPDANAVSSGAVLSDYQRLRVEHVCARLSLTSLAFMWRRPQKQLLRTMIDRGVEAIVIKIAAMGLKPHHLGQTVAALETTFCELEDQYGNHAAGEGGEYETLTLDCPLFTHRLVIDEARVVTVSADKFAPVAFQHITKFHVEQKAPRAEPEPESEPPSVATTWAPAPLDVVDWGTMQATANAQHFWRDKAEEWCNTAALEEQKAEGSCTHEYCSDFQAAIAASMQSEQFFLRAGSPRCPEIVIEAASGTSAMESLSVVASARKSEATGGKGIAELATKAMHSIQTQLESKGRKLEDVFFACIYLADLGDFAVFNGVYCKSFGVNAPSRVCVGSCPDPDCIISVECLATSAPRKVLHVQSISLWAPSCIGPYSQASAVNGLVHCAGQIPLEAGTMVLVPGEPAWAQAIRCFESCRCVLAVHRSALHQVVGGLLYVVAREVGAPTAQALLCLLAAMLEKEGMPAERRAVLAVVAVDALPKGSTVELQLYAEENAQEAAAVINNDAGMGISTELKREDLFGIGGESFSRVMQDQLEAPAVGSLVLQVAGRVGKHCVVHASVHVASTVAPLDPAASRDVVQLTLVRVFTAAFEALRSSGLSTQSCVCVRLLRHVDWAPTEDELAEAASGANGALPTAIVEVGSLHRGEPIALHIVAGASVQQ